LNSVSGVTTKSRAVLRSWNPTRTVRSEVTCRSSSTFQATLRGLRRPLVIVFTYGTESRICPAESKIYNRAIG
jgi:hypothetical protein